MIAKIPPSLVKPYIIDTSGSTIIDLSSGDYTGDITGDVTGDVTGDLTGNVTGDVIGDVTGDLTGDVMSADGVGAKRETAALTIVADTSAHDTAIIVPDGAIITNIWVDVQTQEATGATKTVDIGVSSGDEDGFLDGVSVAAAGTIAGSLANGAVTMGALMLVDTDGAGDNEFAPYVCSAATTICYTLGSNDFAELVANVVVEYIEIA